MNNRTYEQLNDTEKHRAVRACALNLVESAVYRRAPIKLEDTRANLQLDSILTRCARNDEPRLAMLKIFNNVRISKEINRMALVQAKTYSYTTMGDRVIDEMLN